MESPQAQPSKWSAHTATLLEILDTAIKADHAAKGDIQVFNRELDGLQVAVQRGFDATFLQTFQLVRAEEPSACGRALRHKHRVMIPDLVKDFFYAPYLSVALASGFRAVQSTPIFGGDGSVIGILSTHFAGVHHLSTSAEAALDECARRVARLLEKN